MARIPILRDSAQLQTGNQTQQTANLPAVTNASIGKALGDVAGVAMDIQEMSRRANDVTNLTTASLRMNDAQKEFATFQQNEPDESKWLTKWKELETGIQAEVGAMPLTPNARAQLTNRFSEWSTNGTINVQAGAFKQTGRRMEQGFQNAIASKNYSAARTAARDARERNLITPEQEVAWNKKADDTEKDDAWNTYTLKRENLADPSTRTIDTISELELALDAAKASMPLEQYKTEVDNLNDMKDEVFVYSEIQNNPEKVVEMMKVPEYLPHLKAPQQREKIANHAITRIEEMRMQEQRAVTNGILSGSIQNMKQAETLMPRSDAIGKAKIQSIFENKPPTEFEASILKRSLEKAIDGFDPTNDPNDEKTFNIIKTINRLDLLDEKLTSTLRDKFYKKQQDRAPPSPLDNEIANHKKFLDMVYEPKLKALMDDDTKEVPTGKQPEFRSLLSERDQNALNYERMIKSGQIKTVTEAKDFSMQSLSESYADKAMDYWRYAPSSNGKTGQIELTPEEIAQIEKQRLKK